MSKELKQIKADHSLSNTDIADMCIVSEETVRSWLYRYEIPDNLLKLLNFELAARYENKITD